MAEITGGRLLSEIEEESLDEVRSRFHEQMTHAAQAENNCLCSFCILCGVLTGLQVQIDLVFLF
jgi:hypothetical protein